MMKITMTSGAQFSVEDEIGAQLIELLKGQPLATSRMMCVTAIPIDRVKSEPVWINAVQIESILEEPTRQRLLPTEV